MNASQPVQILLVEDSATDLELTLRALAKSKLAPRVQIARDGEEALEFLFARERHAHRSGDEKPRLILLDLKLPKLDGLEVLRVIKSDAQTRAIPVVVLSSSTEQRDVALSYAHGANSYVVKPVDFDGFASAIAQIGHYWMIVNHPPGSAA